MIDHPRCSPVEGDPCIAPCVRHTATEVAGGVHMREMEVEGAKGHSSAYLSPAGEPLHIAMGNRVHTGVVEQPTLGLFR